jgi:hypothetical protein
MVCVRQCLSGEMHGRVDPRSIQINTYKATAGFTLSLYVYTYYVPTLLLTVLLLGSLACTAFNFSSSCDDLFWQWAPILTFCFTHPF